MKHAVTSPIKLSLFPWNDGWRISPRKRLDSRTDGDRRYEEPVWYRSLKSIDRKEKVSKMIINTSIIARFQFHPRYRSLLWESCTCPNGDAWLSMRGQSVFWTRDLRCQLTSGNINDQHSFQRVFVLSLCPTTCTVQLNKRLPSFVILTPWMFVTIKYMMELDFLLLIDRYIESVTKDGTNCYSFFDSKKRKKLGKYYLWLVFLAHRVYKIYGENKYAKK